MIRLLIVEDHPRLRETYVRILEEAPDVTVVGVAPDGETALRQARELQPDAVLMDVRLPGIDGVEATRRLLDELPQTRVIGLSTQEPEQIRRRMLQAGASVHLSKDCDPAQLLAAIRGEGAEPTGGHG